ncbi:MAG: hypothetical protein QXM75_00560 [Candidatus Diapherotrites archaeon]
MDSFLRNSEPHDVTTLVIGRIDKRGKEIGHTFIKLTKLSLKKALLKNMEFG